MLYKVQNVDSTSLSDGSLLPSFCMASSLFSEAHLIDLCKDIQK